MSNALEESTKRLFALTHAADLFDFVDQFKRNVWVYHHIFLYSEITKNNRKQNPNTFRGSYQIHQINLCQTLLCNLVIEYKIKQGRKPTLFPYIILSFVQEICVILCPIYLLHSCSRTSLLYIFSWISDKRKKNDLIYCSGIQLHWFIGLTGDRGSIHGWVIPKTQKWYLILEGIKYQFYKVWIRGKE